MSMRCYHESEGWNKTREVNKVPEVSSTSVLIKELRELWGVRPQPSFNDRENRTESLYSPMVDDGDSSGFANDIRWTYFIPDCEPQSTFTDGRYSVVAGGNIDVTT